MFAEIAIPLNVHQTFTYRLPASFAADAKAGCRVLVPFGKQLLTGYVVDIHKTLEEAGQQEEGFEIRDVEELFDVEPLVTAELLNLTKWIADYYYAPWGETIKSSLPAGINAEAETILSITSEGRAAIAGAGGKRVKSAKMEALARIAENGMLDAGALAKEINKNRASAVARELERAGYITVTRRLQSA
jgi:primosomal protein N' (replication factor Y) (superfamily II helicase)